MDTGSFKERTSNFSWHCLLSRPFRTSWLFFALMALIATESALALCPNPLNGTDQKCCGYSIRLGPADGYFVSEGDAASSIDQCIALSQGVTDQIASNPPWYCQVPGIISVFPPVPPSSPGTYWEQRGSIFYTCPGGLGVGSGVFIYWPDEPLCTLQLTGPGGTGGALADVDPGKEVGGLRVEALCNGAPTPKNITLTPTAVDNSGGHQHVPGRPTGNLLVTGGTTPLTFAYTAPAASGDYSITARCTDGTCNETTGFVWVGIHGLVNIPSSGSWNLIPNADAGHPANKHLTGAALGKLAELARLYKQVYFPLNTPVLQLNDASLVRGGLFDLGPNYGYAYWNPQHHEHRRGSVIDIQANGGSLAIPRKNFEGFRELLIRQRMDWREEYLNASGGHFHIRLNGVKE